MLELGFAGEEHLADQVGAAPSSVAVLIHVRPPSQPLTLGGKNRAWPSSASPCAAYQVRRRAQRCSRPDAHLDRRLTFRPTACRKRTGCCARIRRIAGAIWKSLFRSSCAMRLDQRVGGRRLVEGEEADQLAGDEPRGGRLGEDDADGVIAVEVAAAAEEGLFARVVLGVVEVELAVADLPPGKGAGELA